MVGWKLIMRDGSMSIVIRTEVRCFLRVVGQVRVWKIIGMVMTLFIVTLLILAGL